MMNLMVKLDNQKGFGSITMYMGLAMLVMAIISYFWIKSLQSEVKFQKSEKEKAELATKTAIQTTTDTLRTLGKTQTACREKEESYRKIISEISLSVQCETVNVIGKDAVIETTPDPTFNELWR